MSLTSENCLSERFNILLCFSFSFPLLWSLPAHTLKRAEKGGKKLQTTFALLHSIQKREKWRWYKEHPKLKIKSWFGNFLEYSGACTQVYPFLHVSTEQEPNCYTLAAQLRENSWTLKAGDKVRPMHSDWKAFVLLTEHLQRLLQWSHKYPHNYATNSSHIQEPDTAEEK